MSLPPVLFGLILSGKEGALKGKLSGPCFFNRVVLKF